MRFPPAQRDAAESLSAGALRLLERVEAEPELAERRRHREVLEAARRRIPVFLGFDPDAPYGLQPWPLLLSRQRRDDLERVALGLARLMRSLPGRLFGGDAAAVRRFYGLESDMLAVLLLAEPTGIDEALCRLDVVDTADGAKVMEFNSGNPAAWQDNAVSPAFPQASPFADLLDERRATWTDTADHLIRHAVRCGVSSPVADGDELNLAVVAATHSEGYSKDNHPVDHYRECFRSALDGVGEGRRGRLHLVANDELAFEKGALVVDGDRIHVVFGDVDERNRQHLFRAFKAGNLVHLSSPVGPLVLGDKRNLAVLSERAGDEGLFDADERRLIERYVPWTRRVITEAAASFRGGPERPLPELLRDHRRDLVLKGALSFGGEDVVVGRTVEEDRWRHTVQGALESGGWVVQEYLEAVTYPLQHGEEGWAPHRVVWGPWVAGDEYAGLFVRVMPEERGPVVNMVTGATVGMAFLDGRS